MFTNDDLRHLFATRCIESGSDIPTLSGWLGHKDGGTLAMKTYGHLRAAASKPRKPCHTVPSRSPPTPTPSRLLFGPTVWCDLMTNSGQTLFSVSRQMLYPTSTFCLGKPAKIPPRSRLTLTQ
jgi:hypothetical protein